MVLRKSFYIRWSARRSPRVHEVNPGRDPSVYVQLLQICVAPSFYVAIVFLLILVATMFLVLSAVLS